MVSKINHAKIIGISDHFEYIGEANYIKYRESVTSFRFKLGTEVDGHKWVDLALSYDFDYYNKFRFVLSSDAHQPNWLNLNVSRFVASELGVQEVILF